MALILQLLWYSEQILSIGPSGHKLDSSALWMPNIALTDHHAALIY